jgi:hypothetical protein
MRSTVLVRHLHQAERLLDSDISPERRANLLATSAHLRGVLAREGRCDRCGRVLRVESSVKRHRGPVCAVAA